MASLLGILRDRAAALKAEAAALVAAAETAPDPDATLASLAASADRRTAIAAELERLDTEIAAESVRRERERAGVPTDAATTPVVITGVAPVAADAPPRPFRSFGEQLASIRQASFAAKSGGAPDPRLSAVQDYAAVNAAASGMQELVGGDGGFAVQSDFSAELIARIATEAVLWPLAFAIPLSPNSNGVKILQIDETTRATGSRWGGVQVYWEPEATTATAKKPKITPLELTLQKLMGIAYRTDEIGQDWAASGAILEQSFAAEMAFALDDSVLRGTGAGMPKGIIGDAATVAVAAEVGQAADTVIAENIFKMFARMPARSKQRAVWYINGDVWPQIFALFQVIGTGGSPLFIPTGAMGNAPGGTLLGRPVVEIEQASALGDVGDINFLDMGEYVRLEKGGIARASSIHVEFLTDQEVFRWILRTNGAPGWKSAVTRYKGGNAVSPFVQLAAR